MNYFFNFLILYLFSFITSQKKFKAKKEEENIIEDYTSEEYETLLNKAKKNLLNITDKIKLTSIEYENQYIAIKPISKGETILEIPYNITININTFYNYFPFKNLQKKYEKYVKIGEKSQKMLNDISFIQQSYMAYLLYKIYKLKSIKETNSEINKFLKDYDDYISFIFQDDLSHLPSSFTNEQIKNFMNTSFSSFFNLMNNYLTGETEILKKEIFNDDKIDMNDYFNYRFLLFQKSFNISNNTTIIPFVDLIKRDINNINCKLVVNKGNIKIKAIKDINKGELLTLKQKKMTNQYSYFFYGKTYDELIDYVPSFIIPIIIPDILMDEGIKLDIGENGEENRVDLALDNCYDYILPIYKQVLQIVKKNDSDIKCFNLFLKYIKIIRDVVKMNKIVELDKYFDDDRDIDNIKRIIKGEINFLNKKIQELENIINNYQKKQNENKNDNIKGVEDL